MNGDEIVYSICIDDIIEVADHELDRKLTPKEIIKISEKLGDYIDWYQAIENAIIDSIPKKKQKSILR